MDDGTSRAGRRNAFGVIAGALFVIGPALAWRRMGLTVTRSEPSAGLLEATATSRLFGFQDDIAIRVRPEADGTSRIDMRSKSRDGQGDFGVNAARIRTFVQAVEAAGAPPR